MSALHRLVLAILCIAVQGCRAAPPSTSRAALVDDFGDSVVIGAPATRIVSLNPTTTEILFALGAGPRLVGRTHWDLYPDSARFVTDLGNGIQPNVEAVLGVRPDLVVLYGSNDNRDAAATLRAAGVNTVALKVDSIAEFGRAVMMLGRLVGDTVRARAVVDSVDHTLTRVRAATAGLPRRTVFWKIWDTPLLTIGGGSYMTELVTIAGGRNVYEDIPQPSPQITLEDVVRRDPEFIIAGPVNAAELRSAASWKAVPAVRGGRILIVDTTLVGRPSVRLGEAAMHLARLLHPEIRP